MFFILHVLLVKNYAQQINQAIEVTNYSIEQFVELIEKKTDYTFLYDKQIVDKDVRITVTPATKDLNQVLKKAFENTDITYSILNKKIVLKKQGANQSVILSGEIVDEKGNPLIGVNILAKESSNRTISDMNGHFSLQANIGEKVVFSYISFNDVEHTVLGSTPIKIVMKESSELLDEVVVTALGIKRSQKSLSYNIQEVGSETVNNVKEANFITSLSGKVAGVDIKSTSGGVGATAKVVMRGVRSMSQSNNAIYVIDGIPSYNYAGGGISDEFSSESGSESIADLSPDDIESISVLNGASAAALYGASAANGAILITTKKGRVGKMKISVSNQTSFTKPSLLPDFQNTYGNKMFTYESWGDKLPIPSSYEAKKFFETGTTIQNSISMSTGTERNQTYASFGNTTADGIIPNNAYDRYNFMFRNTTSFLGDKMTLDFSFNYIHQKDKNMIAQGEYFNPLTSIYTFPRGEDFTSIRSYEHFSEARNINVQNWPYGDQGLNMQNPYWLAYRNIFEHKKRRYIANATLQYDVTDWLNLKGRIRIDDATIDHTRKLYATSDALHAGGKSTEESKGYYGFFTWVEEQIYADFIASFKKTIEDFSIFANLGTSIEDARSRRNGVGGTLDIPNAFYVHAIKNRDEARVVVTDSKWRQQTQSIFGSLDVGWKDMLYLTLTGRNDWSSTLSGMPKKGFFYPSVGVSAIISEMVDMPKAISFLKVRGSWAEVGNGIKRQISEMVYQYVPAEKTYRLVDNMPIGKLYPEKTRSWEVGLDARFFDSTIKLDVSLYKSNSFNQTLQAPVSAATGYKFKYIQTGDIQNKGVEIMLNYSPKMRDFQWSSTFTASRNWNEIKDLGTYVEEDGSIRNIDNQTGASFGSAMIYLTEGGTMGDIWATTKLRTDINGSIYVNENGQLSTDATLEKVGSTMAKWKFGFNNSFSWKGLQLDILIAARTGGQVLSRTQAILDAFGVSKASANLRDLGGKQINNGKISAEEWYKTIGGKQGVYKYYLYDATNIRLQELRLSYTLPSSWFKDVAQVQLSVVGRNLWMIYNKAPFDPEQTPSTDNYYQGVDYFMQPSTRNIGFSVNVNF